MPARKWTDQEIALLTKKYSDTETHLIAEELDRTVCSVFNQVNKLGLKKSNAYFQRTRSKTLIEAGKKSRFKKGNVPFNKGVPFNPGGRSAETRFKKGQKPHTWYPLGTERMNKDGNIERKVADTGVRNVDWKTLAVIEWEKLNGPVPDDMIIVHANHDRADFSAENLIAVTRSQNMRRNSLHNYPKDIARLMQLRGVLNRKINEREKHEEQD